MLTKHNNTRHTYYTPHDEHMCSHKAGGGGTGIPCSWNEMPFHKNPFIPCTYTRTCKHFTNAFILHEYIYYIALKW